MGKFKFKQKKSRACILGVNVCLSPQVISTEKLQNHIFRLTGPGADQDPKGLFTIDIDTGDVSVSRPLDREAIDTYQVGYKSLSVSLCLCVCVCVRTRFVCFTIFLASWELAQSDVVIDLLFAVTSRVWNFLSLLFFDKNHSVVCHPAISLS